MATVHSHPYSQAWKCFVLKIPTHFSMHHSGSKPITSLSVSTSYESPLPIFDFNCTECSWCLTVGNQIAAQAPHEHSLRIKANNFTKCVNVIWKPTAYIWFQLHRMLEEFKPKVTTHSPHANHAQRAFQMMTKNIQIRMALKYYSYLYFPSSNIFKYLFTDFWTAE